MDEAIRLRRPDEQIAIRGRTAEEVMLEVAHEFKYLLDVQRPHTLFNPGGTGDPRQSASYARAARLLDEAITQAGDRSASPSSVLESVVPVIDFIADAGSQTPPQALDILQGVREALLCLGFNEHDQGNRSPEDCCLIEIRFRSLSKFDEVFKFIQGMGKTVHCGSYEELMNGHSATTACRGRLYVSTPKSIMPDEIDSASPGGQHGQR